jgi:hypothetical protein
MPPEKLRIDIKLEIGIQSETVEVSGAALISMSKSLDAARRSRDGDNMTTLSLNGPSYTDLLRSAGHHAGDTMKPNSIIMAGVTGAIEPQAR